MVAFQKMGSSKLLDIIDRLKDYKIYFELSAHMDRRTVMVMVSVPGERWEVEVFEDGSVECEKFMSNGQIRDEAWLVDAIERNKD